MIYIFKNNFSCVFYYLHLYKNFFLKFILGYKVYTFKNPYLGNTCVPFQHWACSRKCAEDIEVPAREEQLLTAQEQDREYYQRVQEAQDSSLYQNKNTIIKLSCCIL